MKRGNGTALEKGAPSKKREAEATGNIISTMTLLYLTHRIPYPPNKGDKISTFNMMRHLSKSHDIHLGTFIDADEDWQYVEKLHDYCKSVCVEKLDKKRGMMGAIKGLLRHEPLSVAYYKNKRMSQWVDHILAHEKPDAILMYSGCTGQFVYGKTAAGPRTIFNAEDVDSEKFRSYAEDKNRFKKWFFQREARLLRDYECRMAKTFDQTVFISEAEATLFRTLCPESAEKITHRTQGVDVDYFNPDLDFADPYPEGTRAIVFVGAMDYWPNIKAVTWYVDEVLPHVQKRHPDILFAIVGMSPTDAVRRLAERPGVLVTGSVPDVRPYVQHAWGVCLPLTIARGIQNKALEAMAMGKRIIATQDALAGIRPCPETQALVAQNSADLIAHSCTLLDEDKAQIEEARRFIIDHYGWDANLSNYEALVFGQNSSERI
ncbi:glycosyl transferase [Iodidimonas gelatinilytica]|uniref:Glycosyl transferase n=1 Tax=Iodidimonas gelatinilytica TaxID=1236966 RepID=A0A5A7MXZ9_9PROT|nr:glycosyl transferase [Iodidimonas gelatinilytica]